MFKLQFGALDSALGPSALWSACINDQFASPWESRDIQEVLNKIKTYMLSKTGKQVLRLASKNLVFITYFYQIDFRFRKFFSYGEYNSQFRKLNLLQGPFHNGETGIFFFSVNMYLSWNVL